MKKVIKLFFPFIKGVHEWYFRKPRKYYYKNVYTWVYPEVFPPHFTISTKIMLDFLVTKNLEGKTFLELGCGSGIVSLFAAKKEAIVSATDINKYALEGLKKSAKENNLHIEIKESNLFNNLKNRSFDFIYINPPYYPQSPKNIKEEAWFCGKGFEYFENLFKTLPNYCTNNTIWMILSEDCQIEKIKSIAEKNSLKLTTVLTKKTYLEINYIYQITQHTHK